jgi:hypothetical protein
MSNGAINPRNALCPCGSSKRYKHCCGDLDRAVPSQPSKPPSAAESENAPVKTHRTFVVLGSPRGGTSLLAGALHRAGVYMGRFKSTQYEDPEFKMLPNAAREAPARLAPTIRSRNLQFAYWGWKVPNNIYYIRNIVHLLINPVFLFIYRDPLAVAKSSAKHDGRNWEEQSQRLLDVAIAHTKRVQEFQETLDAGFRAFQLEAIHGDPISFVDQFCQVLEPLAVDRDELLRFVDCKGGYH